MYYQLDFRRDPITTATIAMLCAIVLLAFVDNASAKVVRLQIESRERIVGEKFNPAVGAYERITGTIHLEVDPRDEANSRVADLLLAPRNARGQVEFSTEFELLRPVDLERGNDRLLYFVNNRGNRHGAGFFSNELEYNWLWDQGYSYLWCGWACDVRKDDRKLNISVPIATENGKSIVGRVYAQMINHNNDPVPSLSLTWGGSIPYAAISLDNTGAELTRRRYPWDKPEVVPGPTWSFARMENGQVLPDPRHIYIEKGIQPGWLYDLVYTSQNPPIVGLGLAAIRDVVSYLRYEDADEAGLANPLSGHVEYTYSWGHSQSARLLNHFVWQGFNGDEEGRIVFDGVMPNCPGAGKGQFNSRFAQTTRHGSHLEDNLYPVDFFPLAFEKQTDSVTGETGDALGLARNLGHVPKMMILNSSTDYWTRAASLLHTDVEGTRDAGIDPSVRIYSVAGIPHTAGRSGVIGRALLVAMDEWVSQGIEPPLSRIPRIADGTLVDLAAVRDRIPAIPGFRLPDSFYHPLRLDPGPRWRLEGLADHVPPLAGPRFVCLVPQVDVDGNEIAGVRLPEIDVPLATHCGWYLRNPSFSHSLGRNAGRVWLFAADRAARGSDDDRPSNSERYPTPEDYSEPVEASLKKLLTDRLILPMDHDRMHAVVEKQSTLIGRLRPIETVVESESVESAFAFFENVRASGLEWVYRRGGVGYLINNHGYEYLQTGRMELAEKAFLLNTLLYPEDGNTWDSLAECYYTQGRWADSQRYYEMAIELNPGNDGARAKLARIADEMRGRSDAPLPWDR
jgi:Alpha/beta hydrolase domain/Tetratricopeptide repeat